MWNFRHRFLFNRRTVYLSVIIISVVLLMVTYFENAQRQIIREAELSRGHTLSMAIRQQDDQLNTFSSMARQIVSDSQLTPYQLSSSRYDGVAALKQLRLHANAVLESMDMVFLSLNSDPVFYTNTGICHTNTLINHSLSFTENFPSEKLVEFITASRTGLESSYPHHVIMNQQPYTVVAYPWGVYGGSYGNVIGLMNWSPLADLMDELRGEAGLMFIFAADGTPVVSSGSDAETAAAVLAALGDGNGGFRQNSVAYSLIQAESEVLNWQYVLAFPQSPYATDLFLSSVPVLIGFGSLVFLCMASSILLAHSSYTPIRHIQKLLGITPGWDDGLPEIDTSLLLMMRENGEMKRMLADHQNVFRQRFVLDVLEGRVEEGDAQNERLKAIQCPVKNQFYCTLVILQGSSGDTREREKLIRIIGEHKHFLQAELLYHNSIAVIVFLNRREELAGHLEALESTIGSWGLRPTIGVGHVCDDLVSLRHSFFEAMSVAECAAAAGLHYFDDICDVEPHCLLPFPSQILLYQSIRQGDEAMFSEYMDAFAGILSSAEDLKSIRYTMDTMSRQILLPISDEMGMGAEIARLNTLAGGRDHGEYIYYFRTLGQRMIEQIVLRSRQSSMLMIESVISYIDANYDRQSLSLTEIADHFNVTNSYLSRVFREKAGVNYIDYVVEKRVRRATELLVETEDSIRDIVLRVGYIDLSSFTRKFTQVYGVSPGRYRKMHAQTNRAAAIKGGKFSTSQSLGEKA